MTTPIGNIDPDTFNENSPDFDTEESALRAYGLYVADQVGEEVTDEQAICLGSELVKASESASEFTPDQYDAFVIDAIARCVG